MAATKKARKEQQVNKDTNTNGGDDVMQLLPEQHAPDTEPVDDDWGSDDNDEEDDDTQSVSNASTATPTKQSQSRAPSTKTKSKAIISATASDVYFQYQNMSARASNADFPYAPLTAKETRAALDHAPTKKSVPRNAHRSRWLQWKAELFLLDRALMFTGAGSKRGAVNEFAEDLTQEYDVITVDAFNPSVSLREVLLEMLGNGASARGRGSGTDNNALGIEELTRSVIEKYSDVDTDRVVVVVHNIDSLNLRAKKTLDALKHALGSKRVSVIASVDHLAAPILFPAHDSATGLDWVWHDLTTLEPYHVEMSYKATTILQGAANTANGIIPTVSGAKHVLASVPDRARRLFIAIAKLQIEAQAAATSTNEPGTPIYASSRHALVQMAKQEFIATSEDAFEASLAEFRDHGLISSSNAPPKGVDASGPEQYIWVPLDHRSLNKTVEGA
ncbi:hypothetical protein E3P99_02971 [Wallemia hederae]|uniref:Origin recognition complex subunit 2 n=1 Tax=Wallemia hederae TaxID=1540922 RepID=A0A4V4LST4_9BASI|nr:hypothetical protein E3P99_02971 [Wallemia hederae]